MPRNRFHEPRSNFLDQPTKSGYIWCIIASHKLSKRCHERDSTNQETNFFINLRTVDAFDASLRPISFRTDSMNQETNFLINLRTVDEFGASLRPISFRTDSTNKEANFLIYLRTVDVFGESFRPISFRTDSVKEIPRI